MKPPPWNSHAFIYIYIHTHTYKIYTSARSTFPKSKHFCIKVASFQKDLNHREDNSRWCWTIGVYLRQLHLVSLPSSVFSPVSWGFNLKATFSDSVDAWVSRLDNFSSSKCRVWSFFLHLYFPSHSGPLSPNTYSTNKPKSPKVASIHAVFRLYKNVIQP